MTAHAFIQGSRVLADYAGQKIHVERLKCEIDISTSSFAGKLELVE